MIYVLAMRNFKSLATFTANFSKFNCFVGLNGAGKSSVLQAIDFLSHLMVGDVDAWLDHRGWSVADLHSKLVHGNNIVFSMGYMLKDGKRLWWTATFNRQSRSCTSETFNMDGEKEETRFVVRNGKYKVENGQFVDIDFKYEGSILSQLKSDRIPEDLVNLRDEMRSFRSLELLSPHLMRQRSRAVDSDIGPGGEKLSAYLFNIKGVQKTRLVETLREFYPAIIDVKVTQKRAGWKQLSIVEDFAGRTIETEAKHVNDGLLRILAILAQASSDRAVLLFDEIENGINPEIVEKLLRVLIQSPQQIIVTTHSPMILNYLTDEQAFASVTFVYRGSDGGTSARRLFKIPQMNKKLEYMGPGEAFVDTNLSALALECIELDKIQEEQKNKAEASKQ